MCSNTMVGIVDIIFNRRMSPALKMAIIKKCGARVYLIDMPQNDFSSARCSGRVLLVYVREGGADHIAVCALNYLHHQRRTERPFRLGV